MRTMLNRLGYCWLLLFAGTIAGGGACQPPTVGGGQFWNDRVDASFVVAGSSGGTGTAGTTGGGGTSDPLGSAGDTGSSGTTGTAGTTNVAGTTGSAGTTGAAGTTGSAGTTGEAGTTGSGGTTGLAGTRGTAGTTGSSGTAGSAGRGGVTGTGGTTGAAGTTGAGGTTGTAGTTGAAGTGGVLTGSVMISVTTKAAGGRYQPDNVGAIWIADSSTRFVKSLYVWGQQRRGELRSWTSATSAAGLSNNLVDAVTAATMHSHGLRTASWNGTDTKKALVPDGAYKVCFELEDGASQYQCVDFNKSRSTQTVTPSDSTSFTMRKISYTP